MNKKMNRFNYIYLFLIGVCILICSCAVEKNSKMELLQYKNIDLNTSDMIIGLTSEQKIAEFNYIVNTLDDLYPYWGELEEQGIDRDVLYPAYRKKLEATTTDIGYLNTLLQFFKTLKIDNVHPVGHLSLVSPYFYRYMVEGMASVATSDPNNMAIPENYDKTREIFNQKQAKNLYSKLDQNNNQKFVKLSQPVSAQPTDNKHIDEKGMYYEIIPETNIGYLKIPSFDFDATNGRMGEISEFIANCYQCTDLIIDVRGNGGGGSGGDGSYYDHIILPNITEPKTTTDYYLCNEAQLNDVRTKQDLLSEYPNIFNDIYPISELPKFENLSPYAQNFEYFVADTFTINPKPNEYPFKGRIWMLMDQGCYSSTEGLLRFCKHTGFATLIGEVSGGSAPYQAAFFNTPYSGLIFRFDTFYGLNPDGSGNGLHGTAPDIECPSADALEICLEEINKLGS